MHMQGEPRTMQDDPRYDDVVADVAAFLEERAALRRRRRASRPSASPSIPGIGFGKTRRAQPRAAARGSTRSPRSASRSSSGSRASASSARSPAASEPAERVAAGRRRERARLRARGVGVPRPRRRADRRCAEGGGWYVARRWSGDSDAAADDEDDDLDDIDDDDYDEEIERTAVTVEVTGLSLYTHHGVSAAEREVGQRLILDLRFDAGACDATVTDRVEDTVDYARVCDVVALAAQRRSYQTLEALCTAIADKLLDDFEAGEVWVKATKPEPPIALPVESVSVEVWRTRDED